MQRFKTKVLIESLNIENLETYFVKFLNPQFIQQSIWVPFYKDKWQVTQTRNWVSRRQEKE